MPLNECAEAVFGEFGGTSGNGTAGASDVLVAILDHAPNGGAQLAERLGLATVDGVGEPDFPIDLAEFTERAGHEAVRLGMPSVGCEHFILALLDLTTGQAAAAQLGAIGLPKARAELQGMVAEIAGHAYAELDSAPGEQAAPAVAVVLVGLPGSGKSTLAETIGRTLRAPVFSVDWQLGALTPFGLVRPDNAVPLADHLLTAAMARQLQLGIDVVLDAAGHLRRTRDSWRLLAEQLGCVFVGVECVCPDETMHRSRVSGRARGIPGWPNTVSWDHVQRMRDRWESWDEPLRQ
ncbi:MAG: AAA family ATPase [Candidatus Dormibacteraceae bacterium]